MVNLLHRLKVGENRLREINRFLIRPGQRADREVAGRGGEARRPQADQQASGEGRQAVEPVETAQGAALPHLADLKWLAGQRDRGAFIGLADLWSASTPELPCRAAGGDRPRRFG